MIREVASVTDKGLVRNLNQDSILVRYDQDEGLFIVADGMGGHSKGEVASATLVSSLSSWWDREDRAEMNLTDLAFSCMGQINKVSSEIYREFSSEGLLGGTTAAVMILKGNEYAILSTGDSRVYRSSDTGGELILMTRDDVWQNSPEIAKKLSEEEKRRDPKFGKLTSAVGAMPEIKVSLKIGPLENKQIFLLCSDGIYKACDMVRASKYFTGMTAGRKASQILDRITKDVIEGGADDNYSAILVKTQRS